MSLATTLLSGAVGGFIATIGSKWLWKFYSRPKLDFAPGVLKQGESQFEEQMTWGQYHVEISNKGRSLASNCKPKVRFVGHQDTTEQRPRLGPDGIESRDVSVYKRYIIDITPSWNESTSPTRVDLNRGETAQFDLFAVHSEPAPPDGIDSRIQFGEQKTIDEIRESGEVWETNPVRIETYEEEESSHPLVDTAPKLSKDDLDNIEWSEQKIQVTSADASRLEGILDITWNGSTPEVEVQ